jgi:hypothetical protein
VIYGYGFGSPFNRYLTRTNSSGAHTQTLNIGTSIELLGITAAGTTIYVLQKKAGVSSVVRYSGSGTFGSVVGTTNLSGTPKYMFIGSDGGLVICGTKNNKAWMAKYSASNMSLVWEKEYGETSGTTSGISVVQVTGGGYLLTGQHTATGGQKRLYLVKTDVNGNTD